MQVAASHASTHSQDQAEKDRRDHNRHILLAGILFATLLLTGLISGCGVTSWQRMQDSVQELNGPTTTAAICAAAGDTAECRV